MAERRDPWTNERAWHGATSLIRVINRDRGLQEFVRVPPAEDCADVLVDGSTVIHPPTESTAELEAVLREYDALYWQGRP